MTDERARPRARVRVDGGARLYPCFAAPRRAPSSRVRFASFEICRRPSPSSHSRLRGRSHSSGRTSEGGARDAMAPGSMTLADLKGRGRGGRGRGGGGRAGRGDPFGRGGGRGGGGRRGKRARDADGVAGANRAFQGGGRCVARPTPRRPLSALPLDPTCGVPTFDSPRHAPSSIVTSQATRLSPRGESVDARLRSREASALTTRG